MPFELFLVALVLNSIFQVIGTLATTPLSKEEMSFQQ
jgi:hypothetical protein